MLSATLLKPIFLGMLLLPLALLSGNMPYESGRIGHKNIQDGVLDPHSCRLCQEEEESSFHVIAECPAMQIYRSEVFKQPIPKNLPNPPDWTLSQVDKFLKVSPVGKMLDNEH